MMQKLQYRGILLAAAAMVLCGCAEKVDKNVTWPEWASRPIIENPIISTSDGKTEITAGEIVNFKAAIHDDYNELRSYGVVVKYGDNVVFSRTGEISGNKAAVEFDFIMPFAANLDNGGFYPEVTVSSKNVAGGEYSTRIPRDRNISVNRPASPSKLFVVDENGAMFPLEKAEGSLVYNTTEGTDLTSLGKKIFIAEKVSGGRPDFSGVVWGMENGKIAVVGDGGSGIDVPDTEGFGFKKFGFDTYSFSLNKLVNLTVVVDKAAMESVSQSGVNYFAKEKVRLVKDCEVTFEGFGELKSMLQSDRFEILSENSAKFTGHSAEWSFWFDTDTGWMILNYAVFNTSDQVWITGLKACFPLGNDDSTHDLKYLDGDGKVRYATLAAVKDVSGDFSLLVYLKDDYTIQPFRWVKWSTTVEMTSMTPETASITDGIFIRPGSDFKPGVYKIRLHFTREPDKNGDGSKADVYVTAI